MKNTILERISANINDYLLLLISLIIIFGAIIYYLYALNTLGIIISLVLVIISFIILSKYLIKNNNNKLILNKKNYLFPIIYSLLFIISIIVLITNQSSRALISPWEVVGNEFFVLYGLASLFLVIITLKKEISTITKIILISLHYFLGLIVAVIVYKIGYGFDPFIHQATMELINKNGVVTPKPPYYLGQYSLIVILHQITGASIYFLNKILVPGLTALFLPLTIYRFLKVQNGQESSADKFLTVVFLLIFTFTPFIVTTPQNLTYLFLLLTILLGLSRVRPIWVLILALATLAIHPLAGIPALAWSAWLFFKRYQGNIKKLNKKLIIISIFLINALLLPVALLITGGNNFKKIEPGLNLLIAPFKTIFISVGSAGRENWLINFVYFFQHNLNLFIVIAIIASLIYFFRRRNKLDKASLPFWNGLILINLSLLVAYIFTSQIRFDDLINYEQSNYASRILIMIVIFCLPFIIFALNRLIRKILNQEKTIQIAWLIFGLILLVTALYISYPRFDKYFNSRGYSTSQNDIETVQMIDKGTENHYIVLANQQVSVAALKELGFDHYYQTSQGLTYFYPIPTGGSLYQYYLNMVYKNPDRETIIEAMDLVGVNEAYLVVNKYWHQSDRIIGEAKLVADNYKIINDEIYIFKYLR